VSVRAPSTGRLLHAAPSPKLSSATLFLWEAITMDGLVLARDHVSIAGATRPSSFLHAVHDLTRDGGSTAHKQARHTASATDHMTSRPATWTSPPRRWSTRWSPAPRPERSGNRVPEPKVSDGGRRQLSHTRVVDEAGPIRLGGEQALVGIEVMHSLRAIRQPRRATDRRR
jgi:hypothetical protein